MLDITNNGLGSYVDIHPGQKLLVIKNNEIIASFNYEELYKKIKQPKKRNSYRLSKTGKMNKRLNLMIRGLRSGEWSNGRAISRSRTAQKLCDYLKSLSQQDKSNVSERNVDDLLKLKLVLSPGQFKELKHAMNL
jgi:hypothetical protein